MKDITGNIKVMIVGGNFGYPFGKGAANRIRLIALGLKENHARVTVLHLFCSEPHGDIINTQAKGSFQGIDFEYTPGTTVISNSFIFRHWLQLKGLLLGLWRILMLRFEKGLSCVYLYERFSSINVPVIALCRLIGLPVVLDICEWWPAFNTFSRVEKNIFFGYVLKKVDGVIVISQAILGHVRNFYNSKGKIAPVLKIPILVDSRRWGELAHWDPDNAKRYVLWCGDLKAYSGSVKFLIKVMHEIFIRKIDLRLRLLGAASTALIKEFKDYQRGLGLPDSLVEFPGFVKDEDLKIKEFSGALALLMPLWDTERDLCRFPQKLAEYLASGRPVVASDVGELKTFLKDKVNSLLCKADDVECFADAIERIYNFPEEARRIGMDGRRLSESCFDYRICAGHTMRFLTSLALKKRQICFVCRDIYPVLSGKDLSTAGGAEVQQMLLAKGLRDCGYSVTFLTGDFGQPDFEEIDGIGIVKFPFRFRENFGLGVIKFIAQLRKIRPEIIILQVHHHFLFMLVLYKMLSGCKLVKKMAIDSECTKKGMLDVGHPYVSFLNVLYLISLKFVDRIVFQTLYQEKTACDELKLSGCVIRNPAHFRNSGDLSIASEEARNIDVLWVGTCSPRKQPQVFLEIARSLPEINFTMIISPAKDLDFNREIASRAKAIPNVNYLGFVPYKDIFVYFKRAKVLANTSRLEGFPNIFLQAWQSATPIVSLTIDPDGIIRQHKLGRVSGGIIQMKKDILELLSDRSLREELGKNAQRYLIEFHSPDVIFKKTIDLIESLKCKD